MVDRLLEPTQIDFIGANRHSDTAGNETGRWDPLGGFSRFFGTRMSRCECAGHKGITVTNTTPNEAVVKVDFRN
jgi:hypothetical protein